MCKIGMEGAREYSMVCVCEREKERERQRGEREPFTFPLSRRTTIKRHPLHLHCLARTDPVCLLSLDEAFNSKAGQRLLRCKTQGKGRNSFLTTVNKPRRRFGVSVERLVMILSDNFSSHLKQNEWLTVRNCLVSSQTDQTESIMDYAEAYSCIMTFIFQH